MFPVSNVSSSVPGLLAQTLTARGQATRVHRRSKNKDCLAGRDFLSLANMDRFSLELRMRSGLSLPKEALVTHP